MRNIYFLSGVSCCGKDYVIEKIEKDFCSIQVGKEFRRRYPPGYFKGQGAPAHTEKEAIDIFSGLLQNCLSWNNKSILCSGQPRRLSQVKPILDLTRLAGCRPFLCVINPPESVLITRARQRDEESMKLSLARQTNDRIQLYDVIVECIKLAIPVIATTSSDEMIDRILAMENAHGAT